MAPRSMLSYPVHLDGEEVGRAMTRQGAVTVALHHLGQPRGRRVVVMVARLVEDGGATPYWQVTRNE